jgi:hypothetical protein
MFYYVIIFKLKIFLLYYNLLIKKVLNDFHL